MWSINRNKTIRIKKQKDAQFQRIKNMAKSMALTKEVFTLTDTFADKHKFGLVSQINRSVVSIPSNIAEGSSRTSQKDFARFLQISLGSAFELETQIIISRETGCLNEPSSDKVLTKIIEIQKMITGFKMSLS